MRVVFFVTKPRVIRRILDHLAHRPSYGRAPPQPAPCSPRLDGSTRAPVPLQGGPCLGPAVPASRSLLPPLARSTNSEPLTPGAGPRSRPFRPADGRQDFGAKSKLTRGGRTLRGGPCRSGTRLRGMLRAGALLITLRRRLLKTPTAASPVRAAEGNVYCLISVTSLSGGDACPSATPRFGRAPHRRDCRYDLVADTASSGASPRDP